MLLVLIAVLCRGLPRRRGFLVGERFSRSFWLLSFKCSSQKLLSSGCANNSGSACDYSALSLLLAVSILLACAPGGWSLWNRIRHYYR
ncbi:hypothetical protein KCP74_18885 [Salmonella enterica subsp. enterica]|nr:hypothetical protein KCP74_18885 [Salmonella enterica subsp. enterica]